ncbi:L-seryl-tRNA(Sec) selenium transferase [Nonomuraea gerenzanensis]|uniref:L-seryl-tRNA(Sec) selenium transferase n=1 Tax=Nonomuraea gerenzanensis TaxID=93944 RepID=A0A1M4E5J7_9ACTN|nr:L-seryl-tRNA(Sec) selenium transferase [Nonomuraea gerenzanensis]UBU16230.1 L-seryl-tRNA(Sec) selenium transferase [Nonomuraea gerenzanensis]SBO94044.1 L-seryl-tRNA(Sec) selenium transferase [Nonomuraea gerenzanensis]
MTDPRRSIPRTDALLAHPRLAEARRRFGHAQVKALIVAAQQHARKGDLPPSDVLAAVLASLPTSASGLRPVINATGVLLHTNLGRAPLSAAARQAVELAAGVTDVELDLGTGGRGRRGRTALAALAAAVPAAEAVHVVNNNAAALALAATALAAGGEIVISRGELIEIGDGFRLPDLLVSTGARLREVGMTNRTSLADYAEAIGPRTGMVLKVHPSNYRIEGFTADVPVARLAELCRDRGVPLVGDAGSGLLAPEPLLPREPDVTTWLNEGADLVTTSGDKLLGGPQCGLLFGRAELVERLRRHPLARALRVDKITLAALEATVAGPPTPTWESLHAGQAALRARAESLAARLRDKGIDAEAVGSQSVVGGGGAPGVVLPSAAVALDGAMAAVLRRAEPPVLARVEGGRCLLDLRAVPAEDDDALLDAVLGVPPEE